MGWIASHATPLLGDLCDRPTLRMKININKKNYLLFESWLMFSHGPYAIICWQTSYNRYDR